MGHASLRAIEPTAQAVDREQKETAEGVSS
jgi:hypothetical protein